MVAVVRIVLWSILNVFFQNLSFKFVFVSLSWAKLVWNLSTRVFSHFWSFKRFSYLTLCLDCESVTFHFFTFVSCPCHMQVRVYTGGRLWKVSANLWFCCLVEVSVFQFFMVKTSCTGHRWRKTKDFFVFCSGINLLGIAFVTLCQVI